jgi:pyruvate dehydrogenase E2 component (dihydrolipoamide acetyltransferase)
MRIISPRESAFQSVGRIVEKVVAEDGQVLPGARIGLSLSLDHRIMDRALATRFLKIIKPLAEPPLVLIS